MILHILHDSSFVKYAISLFEIHYPSQNIFIIGIGKNEADHLDFENNIFKVTLYKNKTKQLINHLIERNGVDHMMLHYLTSLKAYYLLQVKKKYGLKTEIEQSSTHRENCLGDTRWNT